MSKQDIIRAWKDEEYRNALSSEEQAQLPEHPSGQIELRPDELEQVAGASTEAMGTAGCCTGNFCYSVDQGGTCQFGNSVGCC